MELAHRGSHPGESSIERRLRYHFFFYDMQKKVKDFVKQSLPYSSFPDKKTFEPIKVHEQKSLKTVAVVPMSSSKHIVVGWPTIQFLSNKRLSQKRSINIQNTPPLHPAANPAETFMKPLGETLKTDQQEL